MNGPKDHVVHAEIDLFECSGEVSVNGIPAVTSPEEAPSFHQSIPVNPLLIPGVNTLELSVGLDPTAPSTARSPHLRQVSPTARAAARLVRYPLKKGTFATPDQGEVLARLSWTAAEDTSDASPRERAASVDLGATFGPWAWQRAMPAEVNPGTLGEVKGVLEQVRSAIARADVDDLLRLIDLKFHEVGVAYGGANDAEDRKNLADWLKRVGGDRVQPLDTANLDVRMAAAGRLFIPLLRDFGAAIRLRMTVRDQDGAVMGEVDVPYEVKLSYLDGALRVVR